MQDPRHMLHWAHSVGVFSWWSRGGGRTLDLLIANEARDSSSLADGVVFKRRILLKWIGPRAPRLALPLEALAD
jgi:hypothetical protein